jgi:hypothetical protein
MRARISCLLAAVAMAAVGVVLTAGPAGAGLPSTLNVDAVVNGTPTVPLVLTRTCTTNPPPNVTSPGFTTSGNVFSSTDFPTNTCTIAVAESGGLVASFSCTTTDATQATCNAGNTSSTTVGFQGAVVTITVTFDPAPLATAPVAVEAGPSFTG